MPGFDRALTPSRPAWRDRYGMGDYLERQRAGRERRDQILRDYRESLMAGCPHGRVRRVGSNGGELWAALECSAGKCGLAYLNAFQVFQEWRDSDIQPDKPAGDGA